MKMINVTKWHCIVNTNMHTNTDDSTHFEKQINKYASTPKNSKIIYFIQTVGVA